MTRPGFSLVEMIVTLALIVILAGVAGLTFRTPSAVSAMNPDHARVAEARSEAILHGRAVSISILRNGRRHSFTALPDGRVFADSTLGFDLLTGAPAVATP
ncbi:MAG: Tfp pilus assembly protein FimT/FimU [Gemmatimonadaceae bacterium]